MRNIFAECGYSSNAINNRLEKTWQTLFASDSFFKIYQQQTPTTGCMVDTGNNDARSEGMSYGMMMAVQMDKQDVFDSIWTWARTNMFMQDGAMAGYFAWSCALDGKHNAEGPAPDGEEFFAMALILASKKWGCRDGIYNYLQEAQSLLKTCLHHKFPMWNKDNHYILFVPNCPFTDPSYHLPHFYEVFAQYAVDKDRDFWKEAAKQSRLFLEKTMHPKTGMSPEYAYFDGKPNFEGFPAGHGFFYSDAYRTGANVGLDALWSGGISKNLLDRICALQRYFLHIAPNDYATYTIDGSPVELASLHPVGLLATLAQSSLAVLCTDGATDEQKEIARHYVHLFWHTPLRTGNRRYYDNCLHFFASLALSGRYCN